MTTVYGHNVFTGANLSNIGGDIFNLISMISTCGISVNDISPWSQLALLIGGIGMVIGGMSASTAGGLKSERVYVISRSVEMKSLTYFGKEYSPTLSDIRKKRGATSGFFMLAVFIISITALTFLSLWIQHGDSISDHFLNIISLVTNTGFGFGQFISGYAFASTHTMWLYTLAMLSGRVEFLPFILMIFYIITSYKYYYKFY